MKKIWWMRRIALSGILVTLGMLLTGNIPLWMQVVAPTLAVAWIQERQQELLTNG